MNEILAQKIKDLPEKSGVYIMYSAEGQILYVGKARNLKNRVKQYFGSPVNKTNKVLAMVAKIENFDYIITRNEIEALVLENNLIKKHKPPYNILLKDDKSYPFIKINIKSDFPRVEVVRKLQNDGAKYYGPYMLGVSSKDILELIHTGFPLRTCKLDFNKLGAKHRPCLNYYIGKCKAPCKGYIGKEEYAKIIDDVVAFLNGNDKTIGRIIKEKMQKAAENEEFELALVYKQKLEVLDKLIRNQVAALPKDFKLDIFAISSNGFNAVVATVFVRGGKIIGSSKFVVPDIMLTENVALTDFILRYYDKINICDAEIVTSVELDDVDGVSDYLSQIAGKKVNIICPHQGVRKQLVDMAISNARDYLEKSLSLKERKDNMTLGAMMELQENLKLKKLPLRMECYDISHISGTDKVASMVVFTNGEIDRKNYRHFNIKTVKGNDDFASLQEALGRRFARLASGEEKDLSFSSKPDLIIIDGGKGQLSSVMEIFNNFNLDIELIGLAKREEEVFKPNMSEPFILARNSYGLKLLQRIRDEAHRFAITRHRNLRLKRQTHSKLTDIEGVGDKTAKIIMQAFGSIEKVKEATLDQLLLVKGINKSVANNIVEYFSKLSKDE